MYLLFQNSFRFPAIFERLYSILLKKSEFSYLLIVYNFFILNKRFIFSFCFFFACIIEYLFLNTVVV